MCTDKSAGERRLHGQYVLAVRSISSFKTRNTVNSGWKMLLVILGILVNPQNHQRVKNKVFSEEMVILISYLVEINESN